jgi:hemolysin III
MMKNDHSSALINLIGWIFFLIVSPLLIAQALENDSSNELMLSVVYFCATFIFWPIQISYHLMLVKGKNPSMLQRIDRGSMLFLIAAIFQPILMRYTADPVGLVFTIILWVMAVIGLILLLTIKDLSRKLAPLMAFGMGFIGIILVLVYVGNFTSIGLVQFFLGTLFLILSGIVYAFKKPDIKPEIFGFHETFHSLLFIGTIILHFLVQTSIFG